MNVIVVALFLVLISLCCYELTRLLKVLMNSLEKESTTDVKEDISTDKD